MSDHALTSVALDMEYRLTIAVKTARACECARYFIERRDVLVPVVLRMAAERGEDPVDFFAAYARRVHRRHLSGLSLDYAKAAS